MEVEEGEAIMSPEREVPQPAYDMLEESRTCVEEMVAKVLFIKKEGRPKSELREIISQISLLFVNLRQVNRSILMEEDRVKAETERAKAPVDFTTLQLHNLMYEKNHYLKAIKACKDFKSKHPNIELVPEEEFFRTAPEEIKGNSVLKDNPHDLMLKRLNFEVFQRKELCKRHEELEQRKKSLQETIANRKKFLSSLPSHLKSLKKASMPAQHQLGIFHTKKLKQHHSAELLPPPLYVLYSQLLARKEAFGDKIDLEIVGNMKDAQAFVRQQANKDTGVSTNTDNERLEDDALDDDEDGQRRRKRPKKVVSKESLPHAGIYQSHPLNVVLHIHDDEGIDAAKPTKLIALRFEYLLKLNTVCVGIEGSEDSAECSILCNLFPDDTGVELPHQTSKLIASDAVSFDEKKTLRPYKWAQHLAGIDFLPEVSPLLRGSKSDSQNGASVLSGLSLYRRQNRVQTVVQRVRSRKRAQKVLLEQLDSLAKLKWPSLVYESVPWASYSPICIIQSWVAGGTESNEVPHVSGVAKVAIPGYLELDMDGRSEGTREDGELPTVIQASTVRNEAKTPPSSRESQLDHSRHLALISKSMVPSPLGKSSSFRRNEDNLELILDGESDLDEVVNIDVKTEKEAYLETYELGDKWEDYGVKEYHLLLSRRMDGTERSLTLQAKIRISMEYPLRPPLFSLSLLNNQSGNDSSDAAQSDYVPCESKWYNELRAMEAEVNLHMLKMLPLEYENQTLAHQVYCLAMLFDFQMDGLSSNSEISKSNSVIDVGLCNPVTGRILARSFRGRDRRKMISWKDMECSTGYPY